ncbi:hypothetical protein GCM10008171_31180 [Methylopila jiangsuensis]|uniref:Uncharacterized protein n=1 Tax=Methylopila jiangsuensis TaxID=586230 RepID=A0A9W6JKP6_9HYPH|nr:hypothetical protein [Methylopila jiangsuensis]MDR6284746.1 hypothetical protein [Methylopila jiangsuensis]GLK77864.1 hypothetical protein GCM10008171_31180 [Methylopila jiangsuensis]
MSRTLFILTSPLQANHARQYADHAALDRDACWVALVKSRLETDNERTRQALAAAGFRHVREFEPLVKSGSAPMSKEGKAHTTAIKEYDDFVSRRAFVQRVSDFYSVVDPNFDRVVLGDYRPVSYRQFLAPLDLGKTECVLLDDGSVSQAVMAFRESKKNVKEIFRATPFKGASVKGPDPLKYPDPSHLSYFTIYRGRLADGDAIIPNTYYDRFLEGGEPTVLNEIWIAGCSHVENAITSEASYLAACQAARRLAPEKKCVYLPHRREDPAKVRKMAFIIGAEVRASEGIEALVAGRRETPVILASFGSTVLDTLSRMVGKVTSCVLIAPPASYFLGARQEHIETIVQANLRDNDHVIGVLTDDPNAVTRWRAVAVERPGRAVEAEEVPAASTSAMRAIALSRLENIVEEPQPDGSRLLLEVPVNGLHRYQIADLTIGRSQPSFLAFRICGEGRFEVRLRVALASDRNIFAECDVNLDGSNSTERFKDGIRLVAASYVDSERKATISLLVSTDKPGAYVVQVIHRIDPIVRSSFMVGNPDIGTSLPPQTERKSSAVALADGDTLLQIAPGDNLISVLRLTIGSKAFDVVLTSAVKTYDDDLEDHVALAAGWGKLHYVRPAASHVLNRALRVLVKRTDNTIVIETTVDRLTIAQVGSNEPKIGAAVLNPYTGERILVEVANSVGLSSVGEGYSAAY